MTQILKKLEKLDLIAGLLDPNELNTPNSAAMLPGAYGSLSMPTTVLHNMKYRSTLNTPNRPAQMFVPTTTQDETVPTPAVLAQLPIADQKQTLGELHLFPQIQQSHPDSAGKITGMLLEMNNSKILLLLESPDALTAKVGEAVSVLKAHEQREQQRRSKQR